VLTARTYLMNQARRESERLALSELLDPDNVAVEPIRKGAPPQNRERARPIDEGDLDPEFAGLVDDPPEQVTSELS
jgi:hypothetical protein